MVRLTRALPVVFLLTPLLTGCGYIKGKAVNMVADTLAKPGDVFTRDDDPELIEGAIPFGLKLNEALLESSPKNQGLLLATCSGFTQYGVAFLERRAVVLGPAAEHHDEVVHLRQRAFKMNMRGKGYCMRAMELRFKGIEPKLVRDAETALKDVKPQKKDVPLLYWTAASWGSAISLALDKPEISIDLPVVRVLAETALALDESWNKGALHEMMISLDGQSEMLGGSPERARQHFARAVELQKGLSPGPYISLAMTVVLAAQDRAEFEKLLNQAIAIDPEKDPSNRLVILIFQEKARALLAQIDTLIPKSPTYAGRTFRPRYAGRSF
jgi:predicted anti-sigma-YlaC factor YlaD